ncbi:hypothetical protein LBMAG52_09830 [Planctomycetia bacterium]|nr:hypothetical protein LBMAG52_09830 [Planctomycetia bacterium]
MVAAEDVEAVLSQVVKECFVVGRIKFHGKPPEVLLIANRSGEPNSDFWRTCLIRVTEISRAALAPVTRHEPGLAPRG